LVGRARSLRAAPRPGQASGSASCSSSDLEEGGDAAAECGGAIRLPDLAATPGRPNVEALLKQICMEHGDDREIGVVAAGARVWISLQPVCLRVVLMWTKCAAVKRSVRMCQVSL
jgi:hypothetical protein